MSATHNSLAMNSVDRAWLEMDRPENPMIVSGIMELRGPCDPPALAATIMQRLLKHQRFTQIADDDAHPPRWRSGVSIDPAYHVHIRRRAEVASKKKLHEVINRDLLLGLDRARPLWRIWLYPCARDRVVCLFRAHHALADGMALMKLLPQICDREEGLQPVKSRAHTLHDGPLGPVIDRLELANNAMLAVGRVLAKELGDMARLKAHLRDGGQVVSAVARVLRLASDHPDSLTGPLSGRRHLVWLNDLPLQPIRDLAHRHQATVNDVFLTALAAAFQTVLAERGEYQGKGQELRIAIPVNLREAEDTELGNHFGLVLLELPLGIRSWEERLRIIVERMKSLKASPEARAVLLSLAVAGQLPRAAEHLLIDAVADKCIAVVSNLQGPSKPLMIAGASLHSLSFFPPQAGNIGIGISLMSYDGRLHLGLSADTHRIPAPDALMRALRSSLRRMGCT